jgi:benzoylsuccinyl-CoA thiolase BbsA subunit
MEPVDLPRQGALYSWTVVHAAPAAFATPYVLGYVDLPDGVRVLAQIDGEEANLRPALPLVLTAGPVRRDGDGNPVTGYRFGAAE